METRRQKVCFYGEAWEMRISKADVSTVPTRLSPARAVKVLSAGNNSSGHRYLGKIRVFSGYLFAHSYLIGTADLTHLRLFSQFFIILSVNYIPLEADGRY